MFDYTICTEPDKEIFVKQCRALERHIPKLQKGDLLVDADGSETQVYYLDRKKATVHNSFYVGAVFIESEFDLSVYF